MAPALDVSDLFFNTPCETQIFTGGKKTEVSHIDEIIRIASPWAVSIVSFSLKHNAN